MKTTNYILSQGQTIDEKYTIRFFHKKGSYAETYRVKDNNGKIKFLKLFSYAKLHRTQFDDEGNILEIEVLKKLNHPNLVKYFDNGELIIDGQKYAYAVLDFISGETLADRMKREETINPYDAKDIILGVLNGLNYLHSLENPIIHNEITNLNVMLDLSGNIPIPKIIDFGYARFLSQSNKDFLKDGLNPFYMANETFNKVFSVQSDIFSVGALYYHLLFGFPPYYVELSGFKADRTKLEDEVLKERQRPLKFLYSNVKIDDNTLNIIVKALQPDAENRFKSVQEFIQAINGEIEVEISTSNNPNKKTPIKKQPKKGQGFSAIAGMKELKETIKIDVIDAIYNKERYEEYGLSIPNGMLLYGPPGCGKTFFAEKLAEEIGFNFYHLKPSDIQSKWVNATQENIKNIFDEARKNAPSIIFIDELDAVVPNRNNSNISHMNTSAVNEFLSQMNNCGEDGIFVIGATNLPDSIDPAILRTGRMDKIFYIPPPDFEARETMFKLYLEKRPREIGLDYPGFAKATDNYVASDIKFICDEAARNALHLNTKISNEIVFKGIKNTRPSLSKDILNKYESIRAKIEGKDDNPKKRKTDDNPNKRKTIKGFVIKNKKL